MTRMCIVCREDVDSFGDCSCTRGKPAMRDAIMWLEQTKVFENHEGERLATLLKIIDSPLKRLDAKMEGQHQLAAVVAALHAKYTERYGRLLREKEVQYHEAAMHARRRYANVKGTSREKPWKIFEYEIKNDELYQSLLGDLTNAAVAKEYLGHLLDIIKQRGESLNKMSDDRRLWTRIDASSRDY